MLQASSSKLGIHSPHPHRLWLIPAVLCHASVFHPTHPLLLQKLSYVSSLFWPDFLFFSPKPESLSRPTSKTLPARQENHGAFFCIFIRYHGWIFIKSFRRPTGKSSQPKFQHLLFELWSQLLSSGVVVTCGPNISHKKLHKLHPPGIKHLISTQVVLIFSYTLED